MNVPPWDAFGDGTTNPAFAAYTWQSGMVALGVAKIARVLVNEGHGEAAAIRDYGVSLVERWSAHYTTNADGAYWWYSTRASDAIAVHNTSVLVAMASQILQDHGATTTLPTGPEQASDLLWARMSGNPTAGYIWNYADDGWDAPRPEDTSHASITMQFMRFSRDQGWWGDSQMRGVASTLRDRIWSGHPARIHGRVDGDSGGDREWAYSRTAVIAYAVHADAPGGDPLLFEYGRSLLFLSYLSRFERNFDSGRLDTTRILGLALLLAHRPSHFLGGSRWEQIAGVGDDTPPDVLPDGGAVRFYTVDWAPTAPLAAGLTLDARVATAAGANLLVDLDDYDGRVVVSLIYRSATEGSVSEWDGSGYHVLAPLPATRDDEGTVRWMRTSFELNRAIRYDYQSGVVGTNVLLQLSELGVGVYSVEASPFL